MIWLMLQHFKKSASVIAIGVAFATIVGCATLKPDRFSDEELRSFPNKNDHSHPHVPAQQSIILAKQEQAEKNRLKQEAKLQDKYDATLRYTPKKCARLKDDYIAKSSKLRIEQRNWDVFDNIERKGIYHLDDEINPEAKIIWQIQRAENALDKITKKYEGYTAELTSVHDPENGRFVPDNALQTCTTPSPRHDPNFRYN